MTTMVDCPSGSLRDLVMRWLNRLADIGTIMLSAMIAPGTIGLGTNRTTCPTTT